MLWGAISLLFMIAMTAATPIDQPQPSEEEAFLPSSNDTSLTSPDQNLSFENNVKRGVLRAQVQFPNAKLVQVVVEPRPGREPLLARSLTYNLHLYLFDANTGSYKSIYANNRAWGEWEDADEIFIRTALGQTFNWDFRFFMIAAVGQLKFAGYGTGWSQVVIKHEFRESEPKYVFWHTPRQTESAPLWVSVGAQSGDVTPFYPRFTEVGNATAV